MLQQTTVAAVTKYFQRFVRRFPTLKSLARADEQDVLRLWQGLGYYRRARHLHQAAQMLAANGRQLPDNPAVWAELPGVGRYILGAVLSQAFDRRLPIVEANSSRVICRLFARRGDCRTATMQKWLWQKAEDLLPRKRIGDFNQALMELGALICTPAQPACEQCPVRSDCQAFEDGTQTAIPSRTDKKPNEHVHEVAVVVKHGNRVLLAQRSANAPRWASMWEFPQDVVRPGETTRQAAQRCLRESIGVSARLQRELATITYPVTRFRMHLTAFAAVAANRRLVGSKLPQAQWVTGQELGQFPAGTAQRRLMELVRSDTAAT